MKKFVFRSLPYITLGLIYLVLGEYFLFRINETYPISAVANIQASTNSEIYYGRQLFSNPMSEYKLQMWKNTEPEILVLGQSVTWQLRDFMFEPYQDKFYNTALMARNPLDLNFVIDLIESGEVKKPKLIVFGLDFTFLLLKSELDGKEWVKDPKPDEVYSAKAHLKAVQTIWKDAELRSVPSVDLGFGKRGMIGAGYRNDGSYRHERHEDVYLFDSIYRDGPMVADLKARTGHFHEPFGYSSDKEVQMHKIIQRFKNLGVELLIYVPPHSDTFFKEALKDQEFEEFWSRFMNFQSKLVSQAYDIITYTTPKEIGLSDDYMIDANHPSEVLVATQLRNFVTSGKAKGKIINSLSFSLVNEFLESENTIPVSFMKDSVSQQLLLHYRSR